MISAGPVRAIIKYLLNEMKLYFRVLGPPVMLSCLNSNAYVPNVKSPIFSDAMRDLVICTSGLNSAEKVDNIVCKIFFLEKC